MQDLRNRRRKLCSTSSHPVPTRRGVIQAAWLLLLLMLAPTRPLTAQTKSTAMGDGLSLSADWWTLTSASGGYSPLRVQITNTTSRQRPLRVVVESRVMAQSHSEVVQNLELPPSGKADFVLSLPITSLYESGNLRIYEHGRELKKLRIFGIGGTSWWGQAVPVIAVIGSSSPDLRTLGSAMTQIMMGQNASNASNYAPLVLKPGDAPTKWIDYTMLDFVLISARELEQMPAAARDALINWTLAGGNLLVYGLEEDRENAPELRRLLDLDRRGPHGASWRRPRLGDRNAEFVTQNLYFNTPTGQVSLPNKSGATAPATPATGDAAQTEAQVSKSDSTFSVRSFGLGQLGASSLTDPFPGTLDEWGWVIKTFKTNRIQWQDRHGISARFENDDFWNFLIPGVGRAPVGGFQLLITLFAVVIGPINYFLLRRRRQLYLLIATVPAMALMTTLLLLGYAIFSDGFALRARVRSLTLLDQVRGESVSWSRVSYYAGVAPSGGLQFSTDTAVYPIQPPGAPPTNKTLDWTDGQRMPVGWLRSRTPTQLLTIHCRQSVEQLSIATSSTGAARVTNNLGATVHLLLVADENGQTFRAENIAPGASDRLEPQDLANMHAELRKIVDGQRLETPAEITSRYYAVGFFASRVRYWGNRSAAQWQSSREEEVFQALRAAGLENIKAMLQPRTYIAVTEQPPTVDLGVTKMQDEGSLFIVIGFY